MFEGQMPIFADESYYKRHSNDNCLVSIRKSSWNRLVTAELPLTLPLRFSRRGKRFSPLIFEDVVSSGN